MKNINSCKPQSILGLQGVFVGCDPEPQGPRGIPKHKKIKNSRQHKNLEK